MNRSCNKRIFYTSLVVILVICIGLIIFVRGASRPMPPYGKQRSDLTLYIQNQLKLRELHPQFRRKVRKVLGELHSRGLRPRITTAWRRKSDQLQAVKSGASKVEFGFHNVTGSNGEKMAWACDVVDDNHARITNPRFFFPLAKVAEANGMVTGIRWGLSQSDIEMVDKSVQKEDWAGTTTMRTGWDPAHLQPIGITAGEAQQGRIENAFTNIPK